MNRFIDLSLPLYDGMPHYPTDPPIMLRKAKSIEHDRARVTEVRIGSHSGTHVDVPAHIFQDGKTLEQMPLSSFFGLAVKLCLDGFLDYDLAGLEYDGILLETGWGKCYGDPRKYHGSNRPSIPMFVIERLLGKELRFFGCDLPGVDQSGVPEKLIHHRLFSRDIAIYENLTNLEEVPEAVPFTFVGMPLNFQGIDGSPVRAVAILKE